MSRSILRDDSKSNDANDDIRSLIFFTCLSDNRKYMFFALNSALRFLVVLSK